ncbi:unnamed protein product [Amaranthus hypochondriacus]
MDVSETSHKPANQFEEALWSRKHYLDTARGHYLSALAVLSGSKQEQTKVSHTSNSALLLEHNAFYPSTEVERTSTSGQETFAEFDVRIQMPNGVLKSSENDFQAIKLQSNNTFGRNTKSQITDFFCKLGSTFSNEMNIDDAADLKAMISSDSDDATESLPKTVVENSSLHIMVESLKAELEHLKKEHAEIKGIDAGAEFSAKNVHFRLLKTNLEDQGWLSERDKTLETSQEVSQDKDEINDCTKGLKREHEAAEFSTQVEKRLRTVLDVDKAKQGSVRPFEQARSFPEGIYPACVSSESSARIVITEDELESSSQQAGKASKLGRGFFTAAMGGVEVGKCDHSSDFSIRDFVFAARNKDISLNWPFSQKNLQLCLKHGVKDVLPPFQPIDSLRDSSTERCLAKKILHSEESNHDEKPSFVKKNNGSGTMLEVDHSCNQELGLGEDYRDSDSFPTERDRNLVFKSVVFTNSQSEVESVSTSNLPMSEVSDEREAAASATAVNDKTKSSASKPCYKKCRLAVKIRVNGKRNTPEDISSACTAPPEAISSKLCPVCENFSSSSNTTLNAHIDQCLSSQSPPTWMKSSKVIKPRIKPRKMRLMTDICATAPCCTLEDLDRRNGTNWATNVDVSLEDADMPSGRTHPGVLSRHIINNVDDDSVYIDSSGRKIRIISKFSDMSPSSYSKASEALRSKKQSRKGTLSKFFSPNRKKRLAKHLKYLKVTRQRKQYSSLKVKGHRTETRRTEESMHIVGDWHIKQQQPASFGKGHKAQKQNHPGFDTSQHSDVIIDHLKNRRFNDSFGTGSLVHMRPKQTLNNYKDTCKDSLRNDVADDTCGNDGSIKDLHNVGDLIDPVSSSCLAIEENEISMRTTVDPELATVADVSLLQCSDKFQGPLCRVGATGNLSPPGQSDEREMFYGNIADTESLELKTGDYILNFGLASSFPEVDPIPIPGPPGSDLPSFSDMGSEDLNSTPSRSLAQPSGDGDHLDDETLSESPLFASSTVSNLGKIDNFTSNEQESLSACLVHNDVYAGWFGASSGKLSGIKVLSSPFTAAQSERVTIFGGSSEKGMIDLGEGSAMLNRDNQQCCCSCEGLTWMNSLKSQVQWERPTSSKSLHGGERTNFTLDGQSNDLNKEIRVFSSSGYHTKESSLETSAEAVDPFSRASDYDSACPSAPILRLMGKDLMVNNRVDSDHSRSPNVVNEGMNRLGVLTQKFLPR